MGKPENSVTGAEFAFAYSTSATTRTAFLSRMIVTANADFEPHYNNTNYTKNYFYN